MKRLLLAAVLLASAAVARAEATGAEVYAKRCAMCHGKDGKPSAVGQKMGAADLGGTKLGEAEIAKVVAEGKGKMAGFKGKITDAEIEAVSKYVKAGLK
jgi:cytochrome c6